jgi:flagellar export protein FliJ
MSRDRARRLERLIELERLKERSVEQRLKQAATRREALDGHARMLESALAEQSAGLRDDLGAPRSADELKRRHRYLDTVRATLAQLEVDRRRVEREYAASRADWQAQRRRRDALSDMHAEAALGADRAEQTGEELDIDDLSCAKGHENR